MSVKSLLNKVKNSIKGEKELTPKESQEMMRNLVKTNGSRLKSKDFKTGALLTFRYKAKDQTKMYDRTPFVMVLRQDSKYVLGINFHHAPVRLRLNVAKFILAANKSNIKAGKPLQMDYKTLKPAIRSIGIYPVIRLYIKKNISLYGVKVPDDMLLQACKMKTETFTAGKTNSTTLWGRAKQKMKSAKRKF